MTGYVIVLDGEEYDTYRDGRPFTLVDAWRETKGVGHCQILSPTGRLVLDNAGSMRVRTYDMPYVVDCRRRAAEHLREAPFVRRCPRCHERCWRCDTRHAWHHPTTRGCDLELFHDYSFPTTKETT